MKSWRSYAVVAAILILLGHLYGLNGNAQDVGLYGSSAIMWLVNYWNTNGADLSYGWIIPLVSIYIVLARRHLLAAAPQSNHWGGLIVIVLALLWHWFGVRTQQTRISILSLIGLLWGIPFYLYGWRVARILLFPCVYLLFCIPPSLMDALTVPLRLMTSVVSTSVLNGLGIPALRQGTLILSTDPGGFKLGVDDLCSGLRSLMAIAALTSVYAYFMDMALWKKFVLFFSAIPLAIVGNVVRVITVALVAGTLGQEWAMGFYHDYSGYVVFIVAILLTMGVATLLERFSGRSLWKWIRKYKNAPLS